MNKFKKYFYEIIGDTCEGMDLRRRAAMSLNCRKISPAVGAQSTKRDALLLEISVAFTHSLVAVAISVTALWCGTNRYAIWHYKDAKIKNSSMFKEDHRM